MKKKWLANEIPTDWRGRTFGFGLGILAGLAIGIVVIWIITSSS